MLSGGTMSQNQFSYPMTGGIFSWHSVCYLHGLTRYNAYNIADAIGWHAYPVGSPQTGANASITVNYIRAEMQRWLSAKSNMPVWITELAFSTDKHDISYQKSGPASEQAKAEQIARKWGRSFRTPAFSEAF